MFPNPFYNEIQITCTCLLAVIAILGDWLVSHSNLHVYKALFDNSVHSLIGGVSWLIISLKLRKRSVWFRFNSVLLCAFIASFIDVDHFLAARSFKLKDATNLQGRPFLHCSTIPIVVTAFLLLWSNLSYSEYVYHLAWIIFVAFSSHHIRDATRRGLWFYKLGTTPPIPYFGYVFLTMLLPHITAFLMKICYIYNRNVDKTYNYVDLI